MKKLHGKNCTIEQNLHRGNPLTVLQTKALRFWRPVCSCGAVQNFRHLRQIRSRVNSWIQGVTVGRVIGMWGSGGILDAAPCASRASSQSQYQEPSVEWQGTTQEKSTVVPRGIRGGTNEYCVLPLPHNMDGWGGRSIRVDLARIRGWEKPHRFAYAPSLSGIASAWMLSSKPLWRGYSNGT